MDIVIARYNENLDWIERINKTCSNLILYNKGEYVINQTYNIDNVGREAHTYIRYILDYYDDFPEYVCFLQGNPFDHCRNVLVLIDEFVNNTNKPTFMFLSDWIINCSLDGGCQDNSLPVRNVYEKIYNLSTPSENIPLTFGAGAQFITKRENILKHDKKFYENILSMLDYSVSPIEAWAIERLWKVILG